MKQWVEQLLSDPDMAKMGHGQRVEDANLGLGWIYYALARALRPARAVVIGSWRGFVPLVIAKALSDNVEGGEVTFIDPSMVDDFWREPARVDAHFRSHGVGNIRHHRATTQEFVASNTYSSLGPVGLLFIDGMHTAGQARFDYESFRDKLTPDALVLFHDSVSIETSRMYGKDRPYERTVKEYIDSLRGDASLQVLDLPVAGGLTLLRRTGAA
jgi:predicted O-methyltransferase YrrM